MVSSGTMLLTGVFLSHNDQFSTHHHCGAFTSLCACCVLFCFFFWQGGHTECLQAEMHLEVWLRSAWRRRPWKTNTTTCQTSTPCSRRASLSGRPSSPVSRDVTVVTDFHKNITVNYHDKVWSIIIVMKQYYNQSWDLLMHVVEASI